MPHCAEDDGTFNDGFSPASLYGGTWSLKWNSDYIVLQTEGGTSGQIRTNGIQADQMQGHNHEMTGGLASPAGGASLNIGYATSTGYYTGVPHTDGTNGTPRIGKFTHSRNRLVRYYEREA